VLHEGIFLITLAYADIKIDYYLNAAERDCSQTPFSLQAQNYF
jgi:hypothetical protein